MFILSVEKIGRKKINEERCGFFLLLHGADNFVGISSRRSDMAEIASGATGPNVVGEKTVGEGENSALFSIGDLNGALESFEDGSVGDVGGEDASAASAVTVPAPAATLLEMVYTDEEVATLQEILASGKSKLKPQQQQSYYAFLLDMHTEKNAKGTIKNKSKELFCQALVRLYQALTPREKLARTVVEVMHETVCLFSRKITKELRRGLEKFQDEEMVAHIRDCRDMLKSNIEEITWKEGEDAPVGVVSKNVLKVLNDNVLQCLRPFHSKWHYSRVFDLCISVLTAAMDHGCSSIETAETLVSIVAGADKSFFSINQTSKLHGMVAEMGDLFLARDYVALSESLYSKSSRSPISAELVIKCVGNMKQSLAFKSSANREGLGDVEKREANFARRTVEQMVRVGGLIHERLLPRIRDSLWDIEVTKGIFKLVEDIHLYFAADHLDGLKDPNDAELVRVQMDIKAAHEDMAEALQGEMNGKGHGGNTLEPVALGAWCSKLKETVGEDCLLQWTKELTSITGGLIPTVDEEQEKKDLFKRLEKTFRRRWKKSQLFMFGSSGNMYGSPSSDMDLCLRLNVDDQSKAVYQIRSALRDYGVGMEFDDIQVIAHARVPLVKCKELVTGIELDICVDNNLAVFNTRLLKSYASLDDRARHLGLFVKKWASTRGVKRSDQGTLSSYAWILLAIFWLQMNDNIPCLQIEPYVTKDTKREVHEEYDVTFCGIDGKMWQAAREKCRKSESESLGELVYGFFYFFNNVFNLSRACVCPRTGQLAPKNRVYANARRWRVCIEDPFELEHDLGTTVSEKGQKEILKELKRAMDMLEAGNSLNDIIAAREDGEDNFLSEKIRNRRSAKKGKKPRKNRVQEEEWYCPQCNTSNFLRKTKCRKCQAPRPQNATNGESPKMAPQQGLPADAFPGLPTGKPKPTAGVWGAKKKPGFNPGPGGAAKKPAERIKRMPLTRGGGRPAQTGNVGGGTNRRKKRRNKKPKNSDTNAKK